jgi:cytochrome c556
MHRRPAIALATLIFGASCVPSPKQDYTLEQIGKLESLVELMRVKAQAADPLFKKRKQTVFSEGELQSMMQGAARVQATATVVAYRFGKSRKQPFGELAMKLGNSSTELLAAAQARQSARVSAALDAMRGACAACHRAFK